MSFICKFFCSVNLNFFWLFSILITNLNGTRNAGKAYLSNRNRINRNRLKLSPKYPHCDELLHINMQITVTSVTLVEVNNVNSASTESL